MGGPEGRRGSRSRRDPDPNPEEALEPSELQRQIQFLEEETALLRRRLQDSPRQVRVLEERLLETKGQLAQALSQNERLAATLREAREQIIALKEEVQRLTSPPLEHGVLLAMDASGDWADVRVGDRQLRVAVHQSVDATSARPGADVLLSEQMSVVDVMVMDQPSPADEGQVEERHRPSGTRPPGGESELSSDSNSGFGSFGRFLYGLRQDARPGMSPSRVRRPSPSPTSSRGGGSFSVFLDSLSDLGDAR
jgi:hypothetical protein